MAEFSKEKFQIIGCDNLDSEGILRPSMTYWQDAWRRLKKNKVAMLSLVLLGIITLMTIIGPMISNFEYQATNNDMLNLKPNATYWFGTDSLGRDLFTRVWIGGRISIAIGLITNDKLGSSCSSRTTDYNVLRLSINFPCLSDFVNNVIF